MGFMKLNSSGSEVRKMTALLSKREYLDKTTSKFDRRVRTAVRHYQAGNVDPRGVPLVVDGKVGPLTLWSLGNPDNTGLIDKPVDPYFFECPAKSSTAGIAALQVAINEMAAGAREIGANNSGPWVEKYINGLDELPAAWCAGFVSWCYAHAPGGIPFRYSVGARDIRAQFVANEWAYQLGELYPEPGDIVVWWRGYPGSKEGHIGLVHSAVDGILYTIEGNRGGFPAPVRGFSYVMSRIERLLGFGRVPW